MLQTACKTAADYSPADQNSRPFGQSTRFVTAGEQPAGFHPDGSGNIADFGQVQRRCDRDRGLGTDGGILCRVMVKEIQPEMLRQDIQLVRDQMRPHLLSILTLQR